MRFAYNERKAAEAAAWLLKFGGGQMQYMKLIKLMYLADRRALVETGVPITGDRMFSLPRGPVLSQVLDNLTNPPRRDSAWSEFVSPPADYKVSLQKEPVRDQTYLSEYQLQVLEETWGEFGAMDQWDLIEWLHLALPEWKDPSGSAYPIEPDDILRAAGRSEEEIAAVGEEAEADWVMDSSISRAEDLAESPVRVL